MRPKDHSGEKQNINCAAALRIQIFQKSLPETFSIIFNRPIEIHAQGSMMRFELKYPK